MKPKPTLLTYIKGVAAMIVLGLIFVQLYNPEMLMPPHSWRSGSTVVTFSVRSFTLMVEPVWWVEMSERTPIGITRGGMSDDKMEFVWREAGKQRLIKKRGRKYALPKWLSVSNFVSTLLINEGVVYIRSFAFAGMKGLVATTIPNSTTMIGDSAFANCANLVSIVSLNPTPPRIWGEAFVGLPAMACLYVPESSIRAYRTADGWQYFKCVKPVAEVGNADIERNDTSVVNTVANFSYDSVTDSRDGKSYRTVKIGRLMWMAENLNYMKDSSWCYDNADSNCVKYGRLYNWNAAVAACYKLGNGWFLPTLADWDYLVYVAGGQEIACRRLKSKTGWIDKDGNTANNNTNEFGFSAMPGGYRYDDGNFYDADTHGVWWSATESEGNKSYYRAMVNWSSDTVGEAHYSKYGGFSVRCVNVLY